MCFWHNRILGITLALLRHYPGKTRKVVNVPTSAKSRRRNPRSARWPVGVDAVRGSSSRRRSALRELIDLIENGGDIAITPMVRADRGTRSDPARSARAIDCRSDRARARTVLALSRMKTWDGFIIPSPFSRSR